MPKVLPLGVSMDDFWSLNPHKVHILIDADNEKTKRNIQTQNILMHIQGKYFVDALLSTVGNMFKDKGVPFEYPKEAYKLNMDNNDVDTEEEKIQKERELFVQQLNVTMGNISRAIQHENGADTE